MGMHLVLAGIGSALSRLVSPLTFCCCSNDPLMDRGKKSEVKQLCNKVCRVLDNACMIFYPHASTIIGLKNRIHDNHQRCRNVDTFRRSVVYDIDHADLPPNIIRYIKQQIFGVR